MRVVDQARLVVVGGHSRGVGKTAAIEHIVAARSDMHWAVVKISAHRHAPAGGVVPVIEEEARAGPATQTGRYLHAGAERAWLCRADAHAMPEAARFVAGLLRSGANVIVESNRIVSYLDPGTMLFVVAPLVDDWKPSSAQAIARAHAILLGPGGAAARAALPLAGQSVDGRPVFALDVPEDARQFEAWWDGRGGSRSIRHRESRGPLHFTASPRPVLG